jgi:hypothetical protein
MKRLLFYMATVIGLASCATPAPQAEDKSFGQAVAAAKSRQLLYAAPKQPRRDGTGMDGNAAVESVQRYWESFKAPPPTFVIINGGQATGTAR